MLCSLCSTETNNDDLLQVLDINQKVMHLCKQCRKNNHLETEADVVEEILKNIKTPAEIVEELDRFIIGQDDVKMTVAVEVYNHFLRVINKDKLGGRIIRKNNLMLTGLSGTGKTLFAQTLASIVGVPFTIANATSLTQAGYVGSDVETILSDLLHKAHMNPNRAKYGIVFIDEIDKISKKGENMSITRDVSGEGVQQALLKLVEGTTVGVPPNGGRIHPNQQLIQIDTTDILFFCGGAFEGIEEICKKRLNISDKTSIGFIPSRDISGNCEMSVSYLRRNLTSDDLLKYGMITEFLGRFPVLCNLVPLEREDLVDILKSETGVLQEYITLFQLQNKTLEFTEDALYSISDLAINTKAGARGLRAIISKFMRDIQFKAPSESNQLYTVKKEHVLQYKEAV